MYSEPREPDSHRLGPYEPSSAARLFAELERAGIEFEVEVVSEELSVNLEGDSPATQVFAYVAAERQDDVRKLQDELFGECL